MNNTPTKRSKKAGLSPGTMVHIGHKKIDKARISIIDYSQKKLEEKQVKNIEECFPFKDKPTVTWVNIDGLHQTDLIEKLGNYFGLHPLTLEDIVNTGQRPKMEDLDDYLFVVLKMIYFDEKHKLNIEQVSVIVGINFVISFQERVGDIFDCVRERIRNEKSRHRKMDSDYLAYSLIDAVIDGYFIVLEQLGEKIEKLEEKVIKDPTTDTVKAIHAIKRELILLRKAVWPLRDVMTSLERTDSSLINEKTFIYLRDAYDHTIQVIDTIETYRDMVSGILDVYLSSVSNKLNEVMKVLTIFAAIFIPLTFIAGIYGMNFKYMPELGWKFGYLGFWGIIFTVAIGLLYYFKKKKWL
ncbi:magnesium/cobalt transporter CorA [Patescibacteria group bacterium]|nr:magnesium/cobalt transporter CorA [Patescibacteria group bacterium]